MERLAALLRRYPVGSFYLLAFALAWLGMIPVALTTLDGFVPSLLAGGGPTLAAVLVLFALEGRRGPDELTAALARWRVSPWWYLIAVLGGVAVTAEFPVASSFAPASSPPARYHSVAPNGTGEERIWISG